MTYVSDNGHDDDQCHDLGWDVPFVHAPLLSISDGGGLEWGEEGCRGRLVMHVTMEREFP